MSVSAERRGYGGDTSQMLDFIHKTNNDKKKKYSRLYNITNNNKKVLKSLNLEMK